MGKCSAVEDFARRGACPPPGSGWVWQKPPCEFAVQNRNSGFSYLGVPAPGGMSDWYENDVTRFRKCFGVPEIFRIVIPAKSRPRTPIRGRNPEGRGM